MHIELKEEHSAIQSLLRENLAQCARIRHALTVSILCNNEIEVLMGGLDDDNA